MGSCLKLNIRKCWGDKSGSSFSAYRAQPCWRFLTTKCPLDFVPGYIPLHHKKTHLHLWSNVPPEFIKISILLGAEFRSVLLSLRISQHHSLWYSGNHLLWYLLLKQFWISNQRLIMTSFGPWRPWRREKEEKVPTTLTKDTGKSGTSQSWGL